MSERGVNRGLKEWYVQVCADSKHMKHKEVTTCVCVCVCHSQVEIDIEDLGHEYNEIYDDEDESLYDGHNSVTMSEGGSHVSEEEGEEGSGDEQVSLCTDSCVLCVCQSAHCECQPAALHTVSSSSRPPALAGVRMDTCTNSCVLHVSLLEQVSHTCLYLCAILCSRASACAICAPRC